MIEFDSRRKIASAGSFFETDSVTPLFSLNRSGCFIADPNRTVEETFREDELFSRGSMFDLLGQALKSLAELNRLRRIFRVPGISKRELAKQKA